MPKTPITRAQTVAVLVTVALLLLGAPLTWAGALQHQEGGFFTTKAIRLSTPTSALVTREIDVDARRPADPEIDLGDLGRVRLRATELGPEAEIFIGIGPTDQVEEYLRDSGYEEMAGYEIDPLRVTYRRSPGDARPAPPADQPFWVARAVSDGTPSATATLEWDKRGGAWTAVVMNVDGRPGVEATADLGLRFGFLLPVGLALLLAAGMMAIRLARHHATGSRGGSDSPVNPIHHANVSGRGVG